MTDLSKELWYHGRVSRVDAEKILDNAGGGEGTFLVRDSLTITGEYVLSLCHQVGLQPGRAPIRPSLRCLVLCMLLARSPLPFSSLRHFTISSLGNKMAVWQYRMGPSFPVPLNLCSTTRAKWMGCSPRSRYRAHAALASLLKVIGSYPTRRCRQPCGRLRCCWDIRYAIPSLPQDIWVVCVYVCYLLTTMLGTK